MSYIVRYPMRMLEMLLEHLAMVGVAMALSISVALPLSLIIYRRERLGTAVMGVLGIFYTIPSIALIILLIPVFGLNATSVVAALVIYTQVILVRNFTTGLNVVDPAVLEAARGMGMGPLTIWWRVQLPLALPVMLAGVRIATIVAIAIGTVGARFGAGGLGTVLFEGVTQSGRYDKIAAGAIVVSLMALVFNGGIKYLERVLDRPARFATTDSPPCEG